MKAMMLGALLVSAPLQSGTPSSKKTAVIPPAYRGQWTNRLEFCGVDSWDEDSSIWVGERSLGYFDNSYKVTRISFVRGALRITVKPRSDADISPITFLRLALDGQKIFVSPFDKVGLKRCPPPEAKD
ncbi:hypothetical protein [Novosphingobium taihuense]|uniref:Uncharacterized protein n=1 Tax=Novosphingobium taihuense TaxID=260085 RepID=A0A7W7ACJ4_9SPHN|nr:hypothetical protein [Novosphingobium taihuense]MBB4613677.1 hypothetical protein [Novosphingobium taihuense]